MNESRLVLPSAAVIGAIPLPDCKAGNSKIARLWQAGRGWRPEIGQEALLLAVLLFFVFTSNAPFWKAILADRSVAEMASWGYALAVGTGITALQFIVFGLFLNRWTAKPLLGLLIVSSAFASFYMDKFGIYLNPEMLRNVLRTDVAEARELFTLDLLPHLLLFAALPLAGLQRLRLRRRSLGRGVLIRSGTILLAALVGAGALSLVFKDFAAQMRNHKEIRYLITPTNAVYSLSRVLAKDAKAAPRAKRPIGTDAVLAPSWEQRDKPVLFVLVVGETVRAANWGLSGHSPHATTPELAQRDVINFADVDSCGTNTEVSVPCLFSMQGRRHYDEDAIRGSESLLHVLQHAGLKVVWRDNQSGCKGVCDGLEVQRPDPAASPDLCDGDRCLDEALLQGAEGLLRDTHGNLVLVLHELGNHGPAYYKRYPAEFRRFTPTCDTDDLSRCSREQVANSYDNAVLYTDHVLARTIDMLKSQQAHYDTALLYVSDHGESIGEKGLFLHGMPYAIAPSEQTKVPLVMWFSPGYTKSFGLDLACLQQRARQPASHDNVFHSVLGLLDVRTAVRDPSLDLSASCRS